jgi:CspA family cold shock protein
MSDTQETIGTQETRFIGKVKWFNNKSGFGFITVSTPGDFEGKDIFAHYSAILVDNQYKYLVQGEYVEFEIASTTNGEHEHQATNISGILGGDTMCETRRLNRPPEDKPRRETRDEQRHEDRHEVTRNEVTRNEVTRNEVTREHVTRDDEGFTPVPKRRTTKTQKPATESDKKRAPRRAKPA